MKEFREPELEIVELTDDVIATSECPMQCPGDCAFNCLDECQIVTPANA